MMSVPHKGLSSKLYNYPNGGKIVIFEFFCKKTKGLDNLIIAQCNH